MDFATVLGLLVRHGLTSVAGVLVTHGLIKESASEQYIAAAMLLLGLGWSAYQKYGQAKVRSLLAGVGVKAVIFMLAALALGDRALATDLPVPIVKAQPRSFAPTPCVVTACSGWYVGANIVGVGSNLDILGSGINGSIFAGGGLIGLDAGYQFWNGVYFAAVEVGGEYDVTNTLAQAGTPFSRRFLSYQVVKLGRGLQDLLNFQTGPATPSQGPTPINIPASIASALASPYIQFGAAERIGVGTAWVSGAGADFVLAQGWNLDLNYKRLQYQGLVVNGIKVADENLVQLSLNRKF